MFFSGALRGTLNSSSKHLNELDSKCRLALFRKIKKQRKLSGSRAVQPDTTAFLRGGEIALGEKEVFGAKSKVPLCLQGHRCCALQNRRARFKNGQLVIEEKSYRFTM